MISRCPWLTNDPMYWEYHDCEWGVPLFDDQKLFEFLILEGAQAGLSWITILKKRENYRRAFDGFDPVKIAAYDADDIARLITDPGIIRNRRKVEAAIQNARAFLNLIEQKGSFSDYLWKFVDHIPLQNFWHELAEIPAYTPLAEKLSKELIRDGFKFVGPTICYSWMQAVGLVNDHLVSCFRHAEVNLIMKQ